MSAPFHKKFTAAAKAALVSAFRLSQRLTAAPPGNLASAAPLSFPLSPDLE
jgi:hypothetical protein